MKIFVHSATECLTDHETHGEGLIFFDFLKSLTSYGCKFTGGSLRVSLRQPDPSIEIEECRPTCLFPSFRMHAYNRMLDKLWLSELRKPGAPSLIWRGNPMQLLCPSCPPKRNRPLVLGPIFPNWPQATADTRGFGISRVSRLLARRGWRRTEQSADLILCTSQRLATWYEARPDVSAKVCVVPVIVEPPAGLSPEHTHGPRQLLKLLWTGRFDAQKQPGLAVEILREVEAAGCKAHLTMIGDGPLLKDTRNQLKQLLPSDRWHLPGRLPNSEVWEHVRRGHFFLSTAKHEPYGRAIVEAMALGCVPVCHDSGGPSEFVEHGITGLLVQQASAGDYAAAIRASIMNSNAWQNLHQQCIAKTRQFSQAAVGGNLYKEFETLLEGFAAR